MNTETTSGPGGLDIIILGLTVTSSWGNGHATTYRALLRQLAGRGHRVLFLERDVPWYAAHRDLRSLPGVRVELYRDLEDLRERFGHEIPAADAVVVGSYVPEGVAVGEWVTSMANGVTAFYDIDTPVTLAKLARGDTEYLSPALIREYQLYLSFTGGPTLERLERRHGSPMARPLYCSVDPDEYHPETLEPRWNLGFLGTYSPDRQRALGELLIEPALRWQAGRFVVAGPQFPPEIRWPENVERVEHVAPAGHRHFYCQQQFTLNVTRADMVRAGYSPSVRLFEAAACGVAAISDAWDGLSEFLEPGEEILVARDRAEALKFLRGVSADEARAMGDAARQRVLACHTAAHRAAELEGYLHERLGLRPGRSRDADLLVAAGRE